MGINQTPHQMCTYTTYTTLTTALPSWYCFFSLIFIALCLLDPEWLAGLEGLMTVLFYFSTAP